MNSRQFNLSGTGNQQPERRQEQYESCPPTDMVYADIHHHFRRHMRYCRCSDQSDSERAQLADIVAQAYHARLHVVGREP